MNNVAGLSSLPFFSPSVVPRQKDYTSLGKHELQSIQYLQVGFKINKLLRTAVSVGVCDPTVNRNKYCAVSDHSEEAHMENKQRERGARELDELPTR